MKIAVILGEVTGRGGMETVITNVINAYNASGNGIMKLFLLGGSEDETWLKAINTSDYYIFNSVKEPKANRYLKSVTKAPIILKEFDPDIILGADEKSVLYSKIIRPFLNKKTKVGSWIHFSLTSIKPIYKRIIKSADFHLAISDGLQKEFCDFGIAKKDNVYLTYNPINITNDLVKRPISTPHFIYVGRLIYDGQKRVNDLLVALSKTNGNWKLSVIGDGKDKERLIEMAKDLGINDRILWLGWQTEPWSCIEDASVLLLTSEYEGLGMVLLEAMSRGIPCISSDCPVGPSNVIKPNENGWLFPVGETETLSEILNQIILDQKVLPHQDVVKESVEKFDINSFINNLNDVFKKVVS